MGRNAQLTADGEGCVHRDNANDTPIRVLVRPRGFIANPIHGIDIAIKLRQGILVFCSGDLDRHFNLDTVLEVGLQSMNARWHCNPIGRRLDEACISGS